ncbi:(d)CMP kinase [Desulfurispira natronophila]|uniref:Cytidylate kinase n=1 Tax=Desulfurispira natronophila TaxID=682562 RepID=A0A7W7Y438_9BACT|nr:(d)CMP kinase [Desulfurispira natronophila]MBB5021726.1 cytidylate kinase [Desulfurispira natronophila]
MSLLRIALDGPGGSGKSTMGKLLAKKYNFTYVDTGAMYRSVALYMDRHDIPLDGASIDVERIMEQVHLRFAWSGDNQRVFLNEEDVSDAIRTSRNSLLTSRVATLPAVRQALVQLQQKMARLRSVVMDGRDIASVVIPDAELKFYLDASAEVRAQRRLEEMEQNGVAAQFEDVLREIQQRDYEDTHRQHSPLVRVPEAIYIDTTSMDADSVFNILCQHVECYPQLPQQEV